MRLRSLHFIIFGLAVSACSDPTEPVALDVLRATGTTHAVTIQPTIFAVIVTITNTGAKPVSFKVADVGNEILLYSNANRLGEPVWNSRFSSSTTCSAVAQHLGVTLPPGGNYEVRFSAYGQEALAKGNPEGDYYVDAILQLDVGTVKVHAGNIELKR